MVVVGVLLILAGALGPLAWSQWRSGRWVDGTRAIARETSPRFLTAVPWAGLVVISIGLAVVWNRLVWLPLAAGALCVWQLASGRWYARRADPVEDMLIESEDDRDDQEHREHRRAS